MEIKNQDLINTFFDGYIKKDIELIKSIMDENVIWSFLGEHPLAGIKKGIKEVINFFDTMGKVMGNSNISVEKLIIGSNNDYLIECQHIKTNRNDSINIDHKLCVLWTFKNNKIISGEHFFADPISVNRFFSLVDI